MTLQEIPKKPPEALQIKFTQLEQLLEKAVQKCQEIMGECSLNIDFNTIGKFLDVNHVKKWSYFRIMRVNDGKQEQVEWIGSCNSDVCRKIAAEWRERKNKSVRYHRFLRRAEGIERVLERIVRVIEIPDYTKSEKEFCPLQDRICT